MAVYMYIYAYVRERVRRKIVMHYDIVRQQQQQQQVVHRRRKVTRPSLSAIYTSAARHLFWYIIFDPATSTRVPAFHYNNII
jgi:hypothetical protein